MPNHIKNKAELRKVLKEESYDKIIFWSDGNWTTVSNSYGGEQDSNNPITGISRSNCYDLTHKDITRIIKEVEEKINMKEI